MQQHQSILRYKNGRYFKLAFLACITSIAAYVWYEPPLVYLKPYGGTALGYTLGTVGSVLILWLMVLGVRKRRYRYGVGSVQGWTSAHVYIGTSLIVIVTLHCAFEFGLNIHTLAYLLMMVVILSGFFGVYAYVRYPDLITRNLGDETLEGLAGKVAELDQACRRIALDLPDEFNQIVARATRSSPRDSRAHQRDVPRVTWRMARGPVAAACNILRERGRTLTGEQARLNQRLLTELTRKETLTNRIRRDLRLRALLQLWLYFHVPLSFALLAALIAHVISVFYFW